MHVVVIHGWKEETAELVRAMAGVLGLTPFEVRQRLIGGGPAVAACFADPSQARAVAADLNRVPVPAMLIDTDELRSGGRFIVQRFEPGERSLRVETADGDCREAAWGDIELILPGTRISEQTETVTTTERKFSIGKTLLSGGMSMTKKVERQEEVTTEERERVLYVYAGSGPQLFFSQSGMSYEGLGQAMKMSRELNFSYLLGELRRLCPGALYDDRLLNRPGQVRLLGPAQGQGNNLDLAAEILARTLLRGRMR